MGVGHIERFNPIVEEIKKIADQPDYVSIRRHNPTSGRITDASVVTISASRLSSKKFRTFYVEAEDFTTEGDFMTQEV